MIRFIFACMFATVLLLSTCASAMLAPRHVHIEQYTTPTADVQRDVDQERERCLALTASLADRSQAQEALDTLDLLERLNVQEQRLWAYYDALRDSAQTRQSLTEQRIALEQLVHNQEQMQQDLDRRLQELRPADRQSIQFNR